MYNGAVAVSRFGQYVMYHSEHCMNRSYFILRCDSIKITMVTEQVRDATSLT